MRTGVMGIVASAILISGCHKQSSVALPVPPPAQPRTVDSKQTVHRKQPRAKKPVETAIAPTPQPSHEFPRLVDYVTDEQRQQYDREIDAALRTAEDNLTAFRSAGRPGRQKEVDRVESLVRQSRQERESGDIATARKLATMARVVSETLNR